MRSLVFAVLWLMAFVIAWEELAALQGFETVSRLLGYVGLALAGVAVVARLRIRRLPAAFFLFGVFVAWGFTTLIWTYDWQWTLIRSFTYLALWLFMWMVWEFADTLSRQLSLMKAYLLGCVLSMAQQFATAAGAVIPRGVPYLRFTGGKMNANALALLVTIGIPIAFYLAYRPGTRGKRLRYVYLAFIPAALLSVFLAGSRTGGATAVFAVALLLILRQVGNWRAKILLIAAIVVGFICAVEVVPRALLARQLEGTKSHTFQTRLELWHAGLEIFRDHPLVGTGVSTYRTVAPTYIKTHHVVPHNTYIALASEEGIVGLGLYLAFWLAILRHVWLLPREERNLWLAVLAVGALGGMSLDTEYFKVTALAAGLILAQSATLRQPRWRESLAWSQRLVFLPGRPTSPALR